MSDEQRASEAAVTKCTERAYYYGKKRVLSETSTGSWNITLDYGCTLTDLDRVAQCINQLLADEAMSGNQEANAILTR